MPMVKGEKGFAEFTNCWCCDGFSSLAIKGQLSPETEVTYLR